MRGPTGTRQPGVGWGGHKSLPPPSPAPPGVPSSCGGVSGPAAGVSLPNSVREQPRARAPCPLPTAPKAPRLQKESSRTSPSPGPAWVMALRMRLYRLLLIFFFKKKKRSFQGIVRNPSWRSGREPRSPAQSGARVHRPNESRGYVGGERVGGPTPRDLPPPARERLPAASARLSPPPPSGPTRGRRRLAPARAPPVTSPCSLLKCTT